MTTSSTFDARFVPRALNDSLEFFILAALFCALIAGILTLAGPNGSGFGRWLFIAETIGLVGTSCGILLSQMPWLRRHTPLVANLYVSAMAIPFGYIAGSSLAFTVLGEPIPFFQQGPRRVIALGVTALATLFIVYLDSMRHRIALEAAARSEAQRLAVESQLRLLRAQLEPHMLFNTLANLRSLVDVDTTLAQSMIDQLIAYLRGALAASREESTTLRQEFAQLRAYLEIMSLRMGPRLTYRLELPDNLQQAAIPPMLLQPLVENAIKHGLEPKIGHGDIEIKASQDDGVLEITVTDSGLGLPPDEEGYAPERTSGPAPGAGNGTRSTRSYGLVHVRERLRAFYGVGASLTLTRHDPRGARAIVRIPQ